MRFLGHLAAAAAFALPASIPAAEAQPAQSATLQVSALAALPIFQQPLLSPDGHRIAARKTRDGRTQLVVLDADDPELSPTLINLGTNSTLAALRWAGNQRLLITVMSTQEFPGHTMLPFLRLLALDIDTGQSRVVDAKSRGIYAGDVLYTSTDGGWALVSSQDDLFAYPSVKRVDLATGKATLVEKARPGVWDWYADDQGVVRAGVSYDDKRWTVWYRDKADEKLRATHGKFSSDNDDSAVDRIIFGRSDEAWILTNEKTGRFAVYRYNVKTGDIGDAIYENPQIDVDDVIYDTFTDKITAVEFEDERPRTVWFDEEMKELQAKLDKALPNTVNTVVGQSDDGNRILVWSGGASDPGRYFLLDRTTSHMHPVVDPYPAIDSALLADVKAVRYQARDGLGIPAYLTLPRNKPAKALPLILLPHGGPFARDDWSYDAMVQFLASRGYAVLQPEFRGSTGYGKSFAEKGYGEWGKKMQDDLDDGVDWLARTGQIDPKRVCIVGASYGGYAAMWGAIRNPERYRCAVSWAGVSDLDALMKYDRQQFAATRYYREWRSHIAGEGTSELAAVSPINFVDRVKIPLFIAHGEQDDTVPPKQSHQMVDSLSKAHADVTSVFYKDSSHDFGSSADFQDWLTRLGAFLQKYNPA